MGIDKNLKSDLETTFINSRSADAKFLGRVRLTLEVKGKYGTEFVQGTGDGVGGALYALLEDVDRAIARNKFFKKMGL